MIKARLKFLMIGLCVVIPGLANAGNWGPQSDDVSFSVNFPTFSISASAFGPNDGKDFHWVPVRPGEPLPRSAVIGGFENGHPLFICHGGFNGGVHPGKIVGDSCNISWGGKEQLLYKYKVLVSNYPLRWVRARTGYIPRDAVQGGRENGHPLFICQAKYAGGVHPGKIVNGSCNFGYGGKEILVPFYRALVSSSN